MKSYISVFIFLFLIFLSIYFLKVFILPLLIALLIFSVVCALMDRLMLLSAGGIRIPNWLSTVAVVGIVGLSLVSLLSLLVDQVERAISIAPQYVARAQALLSANAGMLDPKIADMVSDALRGFHVRDYISHVTDSARQVLIAFSIVILYLIFLFSERPFIEMKLRRAFHDDRKIAQFKNIVSNVRRGVHRYVVVKSIISLTTGFLVYLYMFMVGLQFSEVIGITTVIANFVPTAGTIVVSTLAIAAGSIQLDHLNAAILFSIGIVVIQFVMGNIIEPIMMGQSLRLSMFGIVLSLALWGTLWGVAGMFLAVPIMIATIVVCSHVRDWNSVAVILSRDGQIPVTGNVQVGECNGQKSAS